MNWKEFKGGVSLHSEVTYMVGLQLSHDDFNLTTEEILKIKKLCDSFGIRSVV